MSITSIRRTCTISRLKTLMHITTKCIPSILCILNIPLTTMDTTLALILLVMYRLFQALITPLHLPLTQTWSHQSCWRTPDYKSFENSQRRWNPRCCLNPGRECVCSLQASRLYGIVVKRVLRLWRRRSMRDIMATWTAILQSSGKIYNDIITSIALTTLFSS